MRSPLIDAVYTAIPLLGAAAGVVLTWGVLVIAAGNGWFAGMGWLLAGATLFGSADALNRLRGKESELWRRKSLDLMARLCACDARWGKEAVDEAYAHSAERKD